MEWIQCKYCIHICVNAKTIPVEIVSGIRNRAVRG
jgi:heterodisulfide reductase subunit C